MNIGTKKDTFKTEILKDGIVKYTSNGFEGAMHKAAEDMLLWVKAQLGGDMTSTARTDVAHVHSHDHEHVVDGVAVRHSH